MAGAIRWGVRMLVLGLGPVMAAGCSLISGADGSEAVYPDVSRLVVAEVPGTSEVSLGAGEHVVHVRIPGEIVPGNFCSDFTRPHVPEDLEVEVRPPGAQPVAYRLSDYLVATCLKDPGGGEVWLFELGRVAVPGAGAVGVASRSGQAADGTAVAFEPAGTRVPVEP